MSYNIVRCFIDVETTGVDPKLNGITQIAGIIDVNGTEADVFDFKCKPFNGDIIESRALEVQGHTQEEIMLYPEPVSIQKDLTGIWGNHIDKYSRQDKMFFVAYNASFDNQFMREWFNRCGDNYFGSWFWTPQIDVMALAGQHLLGKRKDMINFKLGTVAETLGIEIDGADLHDALYDIKLTREIYYLITQSAQKGSEE